MDGGTRKLLEKLNEIQLDQASLKAEVAHHVTPMKLVAILGSAAMVMVGATWTVVRATSDDAAHQIASMKRELESTKLMLNQDLRQVREESASKVTNIDAKVDGLYDHLIRGQPRSTVVREVRKKEQERP